MVRRQQQADRAQRPALRSPGRLMVASPDVVEFELAGLGVAIMT